MFDFLKTVLLWLFGAGFLAGFFGFSAGCAFKNPNTIGIRWTGSGVELFQEPGGKKDEEGNKYATTEFTDQGLGLVDRAVSALFAGDEEKTDEDESDDVDVDVEEPEADPE